jgi:hypothetical protein
MEERLKRPPPGVELGGLSQQVFEVLAEYTAFPWPVLLAQASRVGVDPKHLTRADLERIGPRLAEGVARFTSPEKGAAVLARIRALRE